MMLKRNRLLIFSVLLTLMVILSTAPAFAEEDAIPSIDVEVSLQSNGSAVITEIWDVRGVSDGTEYYKALENMEGMSVHSLLVWDESGVRYKTLDDWDTDRSREEKSGTCGILETSDGYELCWGIGNYGDHQYTIQYTLEGLVKDYGDYAGFYHQFVSELTSAPESVYVGIAMPDTKLTSHNTDFTFYGFTGGLAFNTDGTLMVHSLKALSRKEYVNILCRFDRNLFPLASKAGISFEKLQKSADNENSNTALYIMLAVFGAVTAMIIVLIFFFSSRYKLADGSIKRLPGKAKISMNWSVPFGGSIPAVYSALQLLRMGISHEKLISAYLIRWQEAGYIRITEGEMIVFTPGRTPDQEAEQSLYKILIIYTDGNGILWLPDTGKQAEELYKNLTIWTDKVKNEGQTELIDCGIAAADIKGVLRFTVSGFEQAVRILGFKKYLMDMEKQKEDREALTRLWGDYLIFAALFNIGEQVLKSMKALDPERFNSFADAYGCDSYSMMLFMTTIRQAALSMIPQSDTSGGGNPGGGGFSGGGGGGSR